MANEISSASPSIPTQAPARPAASAPAVAPPAESPQPAQPTDRTHLSREVTHPQAPGPIPDFGAPPSRGAAGRRAANEEIRERGRQAEAAGGEYANEQFRRGVDHLGQNVMSAVTGDATQDAKDAARNGDIAGALRAGSAAAGEKAGNRASRGLQASACVRGATTGFRVGAAIGAGGGALVAGVGAGPGGAFGGTVGAIIGCGSAVYGTRRAAEITGNVAGRTTFDVARQAYPGS